MLNRLREGTTLIWNRERDSYKWGGQPVCLYTTLTCRALKLRGLIGIKPSDMKSDLLYVIQLTDLSGIGV